MDAPDVAGMRVDHLFGAGGSGRVYLAEGASGEWFALKVLDGIAVSKGLLARMTARLADGGWPDGVLPVLWSDYAGRPACQITPWMGDAEPGGEGELLPRTLQNALPEHPGPDTWRVVRQLAAALAAMHTRRVAHGNLKPGNVFFSGNGEVLLADWALGNMPGVEHLEFTDAVLYQPPEQLRDPQGYAEEAGYRWDVFAFGVLAYRLLTGHFPRCDEVFQQVAPDPGQTRRDGIQADLGNIALNLEAQPDISWPDPAGNPLESGFRTWIERCLMLDPSQRPATLGEVVDGFRTVETTVATAQERQHLLDRGRHAGHRVWCVGILAAALGTAAVGMAALWAWSQRNQQTERTRHANELSTLRADAQRQLQAITKRTSELETANRAQLAALQAARSMGDRLFSWALEKGNRQLPPVDGRQQRLEALEKHHLEFLANSADVAGLEVERSRARLQLAEIALAQGRAETAAHRLKEALDAWAGGPGDAHLQLRLVTDRLLLALLLQGMGDAGAAEAFVEARKALGQAAAADPSGGSDRLLQLTAVLDFHEARLLASRGEDGKALEQLMSATSALNRLVDQRPDSVVLRVELAGCFLASATILEGMGSLGDAREVRVLAAAKLSELLEQAPSDFTLRMELAGCYGAMAESAVLAGDISGADSLSREAMKLLDALLAEQPENREVAARLAAQIGVAAGVMRDRGEGASANSLFDRGINLLEGLLASKPADPVTGYRLSLLRWQKARMLGASGKSSDEIAMLGAARKLLQPLETPARPGGPPVEQVQRSTAYLLGDLGHAHQLAGDRSQAKAAFTEGLAYWEQLVSKRPGVEEYEEGKAWCLQRIAELQ